MACDIPAVRVSDLRELARISCEENTIVVCPDKNGIGTNALVLTQGASMEFHFGEESFYKRYCGAVRCGYVPCIQANDRIAMDIDTPQGLEM